MIEHPSYRPKCPHCGSYEGRYSLMRILGGSGIEWPHSVLFRCTSCQKQSNLGLGPRIFSACRRWTHRGRLREAGLRQEVCDLVEWLWQGAEVGHPFASRDRLGDLVAAAIAAEGVEEGVAAEIRTLTERFLRDLDPTAAGGPTR